MAETLRCVPQNSLIGGWDFSTGSVKCLVFDLQGSVVAEVRFPTDLWTEEGVSELNLMQLEGQARASYRAITAKLRQMNREADWIAAGISATHHTAGRIDPLGNQVRRAICWNDQTLAHFHQAGLNRLGGQQRARELTGGPWAIRYSLSHLVKDEQTLSESSWSSKFLPHGPLAAGYLTGNFDVISISSAASTGMIDLRTGKWRKEMLEALESPQYQDLVWSQLPRIMDLNEPIGRIGEHLTRDPLVLGGPSPMIFPTLDDQAAGLVGGGAVDAGQVAVILGNSAVVNSSSSSLPSSSNLDAMRLNWGPYLWMRCYSNGAQFLDRVVGHDADWQRLEAAARAVEAGAQGYEVLPFSLSEPALGVHSPRFEWFPGVPEEVGVKVRASFEALAYLIALAVQEHEAAGQKITRLTLSGGIARSELMCEILASVLNRRLERLVSSEGTALGAAVVALAGMESHLRSLQKFPVKYTVADAVATLVKFREPVSPNPAWVGTYQAGLQRFTQRVSSSS